jgi:predicted small lipoprotein YifL
MSAKIKLCLLLLTAGVAALSACGQSGPLTLPEPARAEQADEDAEDDAN